MRLKGDFLNPLSNLYIELAILVVDLNYTLNRHKKRGRESVYLESFSAFSYMRLPISYTLNRHCDERRPASPLYLRQQHLLEPRTTALWFRSFESSMTKFPAILLKSQIPPAKPGACLCEPLKAV